MAQEHDEPERVGRETWMQWRLGFEKGIRKYNAQVLANAANDDTSFSEWRFELELEGMGPQTAVFTAAERHRLVQATTTTISVCRSTIPPGSPAIRAGSSVAQLPRRIRRALRATAGTPVHGGECAT